MPIIGLAPTPPETEPPLAITVTLQTDKSTYTVGETITATLNVTGNDGSERVVTLTGTVRDSDGTEFTVTGDVTLSTPAGEVEYVGVTGSGLSFTRASDAPNVFTATAA